MIEDRPFIDIVSKKWGYEKIIVNDDKYCGKLLHIVKGKNTSLHYHKTKDETFYIHSGKLKVYYTDDMKKANRVVGEGILNPNTGVIIPPLHLLESVTLHAGDAFRVMPERVHQLYAVEDVVLYEFSTKHAEEDTVRLIK